MFSVDSFNLDTISLALLFDILSTNDLANMNSIRIRVMTNIQVLRGVRVPILALARVRSTMCEPIVTVKQGKLRGVFVTSALGSSYLAFKSIPFAAPPVGDLRFKDPQPPASWTGIKDTSDAVVRLCPQLLEIQPFNVVGDEDCLYLNVYTNSLDQRKPVMFWIHGGAFVLGSADFEYYRPDYLVEKDVVVVTVPYRLGAFGFLNLGHRVAPGNQGLKDLIAALQWVKENIANFGGDPMNVTIFGVSAGGALVQCLMLSPSAKGLFHKAILQSGTIFSPWSDNQSRPERCFKLASLLGKDSTDPVEVFEFLRTVSAVDIVKAQKDILMKEESSKYNLAFGLNCDAVAENPVLPRPLKDLEEADIPVIVGYTADEFIMFFSDNSDNAFAVYNQFLPAHVENMASTMKLSGGDKDKLMDAVKKKYFNGKSISKETVDGLIKFMTDVYFGVPAILVAEDRVRKAKMPTYLYRYSYVGNEKTPTDILLKRLANGASHVDEVAYLFYIPQCKTTNPDAPAVGSKDRSTLERMTTMWSNFAKTGNPTACKNEFVTISWSPLNAKERCYLDIGDELKLVPLPPNILDDK